MSEKTELSLENLNLSKQCDNGYEFELTDTSGSPMGVFITVLGSSAEAPKKAIRKRVDLERKQNDMLVRKGKDVPLKTLDELEEINIGDLAHYVVSWTGLKESCNYENVCRLFKINDDIRRQVLTETEKLENFIKSK